MYVSPDHALAQPLLTTAAIVTINCRRAVLAKAGDVFRVDGWYDSAHNKFIEEVLAAAEKLSAPQR